MNGFMQSSVGWPVIGIPSGNAYRVSDDCVDMRRPQRPTNTTRLPALPQSLILDRGRTALIVIDMVNDFCAPDGWIASMGVDVGPARALAEPINRAADALRAAGAPVIWVNWGVRPDRLNLSPGTQHPFNPNGRGPGLAGEQAGAARTHKVLTAGSWGSEIIDTLTQRPEDIHVDKHRISGFWDTPLDAILRNLGVTTLFFAGVNADHCVLGTLMDANFHGYDTVMLEDCVATTSPDFCLQATFHNVRFCFGFTTTSADLAASFAAAEA
ncbi:cysteine hydrolase family protein [Sphingomonas bacterium]|uniref:cysteine hydrolase family protein n=1 Tax=Sphingomonas bacterium TaxID=1895847 RepID=UPI001C2DAEBD|nr:isochorismatase family cysteine hydrolase [Sphingomonas bacterium]